jgi:orotidine-5'-phosphate decarboxylase
MDVDVEEAPKLLASLRGRVGIIKLPPALLYLRGHDIIREVRDFGYSVFADVKLHDIPATVAHGVRSLSCAGADFITIHLSGGSAMARAAVDAAADPSRILGVAVLSSLSNQDQERLFGRSGVELVLNQYALGAEADLTGFVCPPWALPAARERFPRVVPPSPAGWSLVVPGLRWESDPDDHAHTMNPESAARAGADVLVLGRTLVRALQTPDGITRLAALRSL